MIWNLPTPVTDPRAVRRREAILDAARRLFAERGYAATSIEQLAKEAGVALRTIYLAFGSKRGVLVALAYAIPSSAGQELAEHFLPDVRDPNRLIAAVARSWRNVYERSGDLIATLRDGAAMEPELREAYEVAHSFERASMQGFCERLEGLRVLRSGLDADEAAGHALVLACYEGYTELVHRRRWTNDRYEKWLRTALKLALLKPRRPRAQGQRRT